MYWFRRPPYLRRAAAVTIVLVALAFELRPAPTELHPFVAADTPAGAVPEIEWREVPAGLLAAPDPAGGVAARDLAAGEPLLESGLRRSPLVPPDWWALAVEIPARAPPGTPVLLTITSPPAVVEGVVVEAGAPDAFGAAGPTALVAVPENQAAAVAAAAAGRDIVVMLAPAGP